MAYPRELLNEGEELNLDLRPHWWYFARHFLFGFILIIILIGISLVKGTATGKTGAAGDALDGFNNWAHVIWFIAVLVWILMLVVQYFQWNFTQFVVTSDRIVFRTGVIGKRGVEIPLERVNNINFGQTAFERIIGAGTLEIESAGQDGQSTFRDVRHPDAVQQEIYRCMEANVKKTAMYSTDGLQAAMTTATSNNGPMSIPEQIEKLAQLRDQGVLTDAEFLDKKQRLLDQI